MPYKARKGNKGIKTGDMHTQEQYDMAKAYVNLPMAKKKLAGNLGMSVAELNRNLPSRKSPPIGKGAKVRTGAGRTTRKKAAKKAKMHY